MKGILTMAKVKYGFIGTDGRYIINPQFDNVSYFAKNGLALVEVDKKYGYINKNGQYVIEAKYDNASDFFDDGYAIAYTYQKGSSSWWGGTEPGSTTFAIIDGQGNVIISSVVEDD